MPIERKVTSDDAAREIWDLLNKGRKPKPNFVQGVDATGEGGEGDAADWNPMTDAGDLIYGGTSGAPRRHAIGTEGDVLTVEDGVPAWRPATADVISARYRSPLYSTYGGGSLLFDSDGHLIYTLEELE